MDIVKNNSNATEVRYIRLIYIRMYIIIDLFSYICGQWTYILINVWFFFVTAVSSGENPFFLRQHDSNLFWETLFPFEAVK
jgi:hypothetical protein